MLLPAPCPTAIPLFSPQLSASWHCHHVQMCSESHSPPAASLQPWGKKQAHILPALGGAQGKGDVSIRGDAQGLCCAHNAAIAVGLTGACGTDWEPAWLREEGNTQLGSMNPAGSWSAVGSWHRRHSNHSGELQS